MRTLPYECQMLEQQSRRQASSVELITGEKACSHTKRIVLSVSSYQCCLTQHNTIIVQWSIKWERQQQLFEMLFMCSHRTLSIIYLSVYN